MTELSASSEWSTERSAAKTSKIIILLVGDLRPRDSNVTPSIKDGHIEVIIETILLLACHSYQSR